MNVIIVVEFHFNESMSLVHTQESGELLQVQRLEFLRIIFWPSTFIWYFRLDIWFHTLGVYFVEWLTEHLCVFSSVFRKPSCRKFTPWNFPIANRNIHTVKALVNLTIRPRMYESSSYNIYVLSRLNLVNLQFLWLRFRNDCCLDWTSILPRIFLITSLQSSLDWTKSCYLSFTEANVFSAYEYNCIVKYTFQCHFCCRHYKCVIISFALF